MTPFLIFLGLGLLALFLSFRYRGTIIRAFRYLVDFRRRKYFIMGVSSVICVLFIFLVARPARTQPYYTNNGFGARQYNDSLIPPAQPAVTLQKQQNLGIYAGTLTLVGLGTITNTFPTNYLYSSAPTVVVTPLTGAAGSDTNAVKTNQLTITTTNFIYTSGVNGQTVKYVVIGQ